MMRIIRISTDNKISIHDFPEGSYQVQNEALRQLIGPRCELYETDKHGHVIAGNLDCRRNVGSDGIDFCGISDSQFDLLYPKLEELTKKAREFV